MTRKGPPASLAVDWSSHKLAASIDDGSVGVWTFATGTPPMRPQAGGAVALALGRARRWLAAGNSAGALQLWDTRQRKEVALLGPLGESVWTSASIQAASCWPLAWLTAAESRSIRFPVSDSAARQP